MANDRVADSKQRVTFTWEDDPTQIITFDATPREMHKSATEPSDHPIEGGSKTSDHLENLPDVLELLGVVTDDPLRNVDGSPIRNREADTLPANTGGDATARASSAYAFLRESKDRKKLVRVFTKLRDYRNMAITSLNVIREPGQSRIMNGEIRLREIFVAITEDVEAPTPAQSTAPARRKKRNQGKAEKEAEGDANKGKARSTASKLVEKLASQF